VNTLRLVLGDQLSDSLSSLADCDKAQDLVLLCEVAEEASYVQHHVKKIAFLFSAMRHFALRLKAQGYRVCYVRLDDPENSGSLLGGVTRVAAKYQAKQLVVTEPGEYRLADSMSRWSECLSMQVEIRQDDRFLCSIDEFRHWASGRKQLRMEYFYRQMRQRYNILMTGQGPEGGQWNFDADNRKRAPQQLAVPAPFNNPVDEITGEVLALVADRFSHHFGKLEPFYFAVTREQALEALALFIEQRLASFGDYQDAMLQGEPWMYHAHLSFYLNCGLLLPKECIDAAELAYQQGAAPLNAVEGFIRQILGWREYVRGIYWLQMPGYAEQNALDAQRDLPSFYWSAKTDMNCLHQCVKETEQNAYAHHIQRLMVLGNFALLAGIAPKQLNRWYLEVYADAYEWVELPNVTGMVLFADGGLLASKPYAAGGSYINKMSNYCASCRYKVREKNGADACPFNYLYWDFISRNRTVLANNPRLAMIYRSLDKMPEQKRLAIAEDSQRFLAQLS